MSEKSSMNTLRKEIEEAILAGYHASGFDIDDPQVVPSKIPAVAQFQSNACFALAKKLGQKPLDIAQAVAQALDNSPILGEVQAAEPGFINIIVDDCYLAKMIATASVKQVCDEDLKESVVIDYGGPNVAKPLHVGHVRPALIGEAIKRIGRALGHQVVSDVHLGDWGLQMGMVINELQTRHPDWVYFDSSVSGPYPEESPLTIEDLESLYPEASQRAKAHESVMSEARRATVELQNGRPGYRALWQHFIHISVADVKQVYDRLGVDFDLWLGESDAHDVLVQQIDHLISSGWAHESDGALIIDVAEEGDTKEMPPLLLRNSDGAVLYGGTDLATIKQRVGTYHPDAIIVVADKRQSLHFQQVFRAALKVGYVSDVEKLEHVGFGTVNGPDNKPFKTRDGGTMKLDDFLSMVIANAKERIAEVQQGTKFSDEERESIAQMVGLATIKFADLVTHHTKDYVFDLERFSSFEGYTGPYVLYSAVRAKAILAKGESEGSVPGQAGAPQVDEERALAIKLLEYPDVLQASWKERTPSILCDYTYELANAFSSFYHACPILNDEDEGRRSGRLLLVSKVHDTLVASLYLLGMEVPERM